MRILRFAYLYYRRNPVASGEWFDSLPHFSCRKTIHDNILSCRKCETICVDCEWNKICYINESKNKKLICWINEEDKILSFHQEEGFVQNEFTDRDELRCFLLAVSGIYRM